MPKNLSPGVAMLTMTLLLAAGCADSRDERFRQLAEQTIRQQAAQNERMAKQSQQIAEASKHLVANDAQARKEMIAAHAALQKELQTERSNINRQLSELESERREIAKQRGRDPIVAQAITAFGLTLACLLPLLLAGYIIRAVTQTGDESAALGEMLVMEIVAEKPKLLPIAPRPVTALEHASPQDDDESAASNTE